MWFPQSTAFNPYKHWQAQQHATLLFNQVFQKPQNLTPIAEKAARVSISTPNGPCAPTCTPNLPRMAADKGAQGAGPADGVLVRGGFGLLIEKLNHQATPFNI